MVMKMLRTQKACFVAGKLHENTIFTSHANFLKKNSNNQLEDVNYIKPRLKVTLLQVC